MMDDDGTQMLNTKANECVCWRRDRDAGEYRIWLHSPNSHVVVVVATSFPFPRQPFPLSLMDDSRAKEDIASRMAAGQQAGMTSDK